MNSRKNEKNVYGYNCAQMITAFIWQGELMEVEGEDSDNLFRRIKWLSHITLT